MEDIRVRLNGLYVEITMGQVTACFSKSSTYEMAARLISLADEIPLAKEIEEKFSKQKKVLLFDRSKSNS